MDYFWYCYIFILGSIIGSFLNVCICRIPKKESIVVGRSHCPDCDHVLSFLEMIPIVSYLFLGGKCKVCKKHISLQYPLVELLNALLYLAAIVRFGFTAKAALCCVFFSVLIVAGGIDLNTMEIPDILHLWILGLGILMVCLEPSRLVAHVIGLFVLSIPMLLLSLLTDGFGGGDIKLCGACGLFLGFSCSLVGFLFACVIAAIWGCFLLLTKKANAKTAFAFGPFLTLGFILAGLYGDVILQSYLSLFS